ncbi:MAG: metalloregulator ArsR/SmtB family transcription factor [Thermoanaerobaculia bacterium]|nr:metalloregulator ArsR/SmtB family transcription factor [Thermoanaerobaculia bacterium]
MNSYASVLHALADPTRRTILESLRKGPRAVNEIAAGLPVSRPAVSQHLRVLREAGLVSETPVGTKRLYRTDPEGLEELRRYLEEMWGEALESFRASAEKRSRKSRRKR